MAGAASSIDEALLDQLNQLSLSSRRESKSETNIDSQDTVNSEESVLEREVRNEKHHELEIEIKIKDKDLEGEVKIEKDNDLEDEIKVEDQNLEKEVKIEKDERESEVKVTDQDLQSAVKTVKDDKSEDEKEPKNLDKSGDEEISPEELEDLECPFTWKPVHVPPGDTPEAIIRKVAEKSEETIDGDDLKWRQCVFHLVLCYEYYRKGDLQVSMAEIAECSKILKENSDNDMFATFPNATYHVVLGCKVHILNTMKNFSEARVLLRELIPYNKLNNVEKAAISGIKSAVHMEYGFTGTKEAVGFIKEAISWNSGEAEWHFLLGKCLGRIRRVENYNNIPSSDELKSLEKAVNLNPRSSYLIFLAEAYREAAFRAFSLNRENLGRLKGVLREMNRKSLEYYDLALKNKGDCSHVVIRCAKGFMKLPYPFKNETRAKQCIDKALVIAPNNPMANHVAGTYYEHVAKDVERAMLYYKLSGDNGAYGAYMDLFRLKYDTYRSYDPVPDLIQLLSRFQEKPRQLELRLQVVSYNLFIKNNLKEAAQMWKEVLENELDISKMEIHKCNFLKMRKPVNIFEVMYDEMRLAVKNAKVSNDDKGLYRDLILKCMELNPDLDSVSPKPRRRMVLRSLNS